MSIIEALLISMPQKSLFAKFKSLDDLVRFITFSPSPFIHHIEMKGKHVYFVQLLAFMRSPMIYFVELDERVEGKYLVFNRFRDEVSVSNHFGSDGQTTYIPILDLENTNVFTEHPLE